MKNKKLSQSTGILPSIINATVPGSQKLQFPYELPTVTIGIDQETKNTLYTLGGILAGGIILGIILNKKL